MNTDVLTCAGGCGARDGDECDCPAEGPEEAGESPCGIHLSPPMGLDGCALCAVKIAAIRAEPRYERPAFANE